MFDRKTINSRLTMVSFILAIAMFILSMASNSGIGDTERIAKSTRTRIEDRIEILEGYVAKALSTEGN